MRILGIDPGLATVGYGVIDYNESELKLVDYGTVTTPPDLKLPERLDIRYKEMM